MSTSFPITGLIGTDDEGFVLAHVTGYDLDTAAQLLNRNGISPAEALAAERAEKADPTTRYHEGGYVTRAPFRLFSDFTGADPRFRGYVPLEADTVNLNLSVDTTPARDQVQSIRDVVERVRASTAANRELGERIVIGDRQVVPVTPATAGVGSYPDGNPKTAMGMKKPDLSVVPASSLLHLATAMMNGSVKYGPYNYRDQPVSARTYIAAAMRHLLSYLDGEDFSSDTEEAGAPVHHLAHVMACCAILLDTTEVGTLNDNRPSVAGKAGEMVDRFNDTGTLKVA